MRIVREIPVPWTAYTVAFSGDCTRLAIGGGSWYGFGGFTVIDLGSDERVETRLADLPKQGGTVAGLHWSRDDRNVLAATWTSSQRPGPVLALGVLGCKLREVATRGIGGSSGTPTGIVTIGSTSYVRTVRGAHDQAFVTVTWPDELGLDPSPMVQHLTGNRLVITRDRMVTGNHMLRLGNERLRSGLVMRGLADPTTVFRLALGKIDFTAIGVTARDLVVTGNAEGLLEAWRWAHVDGEDQPRQYVAVRAQIPEPMIPAAARFISYQPTAVVSICSLADGRIAAVTAGGMLAIWRPGDPATAWQLPVQGSPRAIAAHPDRPLVAVGLKRGGFASPDASVALVEIEPEVAVSPRLRTERVIAMARAADRQRTPARAFDPTTLGVLADALEELAAPPEILEHLRDHGSRCTTCWVIEQLLE